MAAIVKAVETFKVPVQGDSHPDEKPEGDADDKKGENPSSPLVSSPDISLAVKVGIVPRQQLLSPLHQVHAVVFFRPPPEKFSYFLGDRGYFCYCELFARLKDATLFKSPPVSMGSCMGREFHTQSMRKMEETMVRWAKKYSRMEERMNKFFERAFMLNEDKKITAQDRRSAFHKLAEELDIILATENAPHDLENFKTVLQSISPLKMFLKPSSKQRCSSTYDEVEYPDLINGDSIFIEKEGLHWQAECDVVESVYHGYSALIGMHVRYLEQLISGFHLLQKELLRQSR